MKYTPNDVILLWMKSMVLFYVKINYQKVLYYFKKIVYLSLKENKYLLLYTTTGKKF